MNNKIHKSASKQIQRLAICSASIYGAISAHALTVNGTQTLNGGGTANETNVSVSTSTANSQLNIINYTLNVSDFFRVGAGNGLGGSVVQTGGLVNYNQTIGGPGYDTSQFVVGHWNGGANPANYNISAGELRVTNADTIIGWDGTGNLNVSGTALVNVQTMTMQRHNGGSGPSTLNVSGGTVNATYFNKGGRNRGAKRRNG